MACLLSLCVCLILIPTTGLRNEVNPYFMDEETEALFELVTRTRGPRSCRHRRTEFCAVLWTEGLNEIQYHYIAGDCIGSQKEKTSKLFSFMKRGGRQAELSRDGWSGLGVSQAQSPPGLCLWTTGCLRQDGVGCSRAAASPGRLGASPE